MIVVQKHAGDPTQPLFPKVPFIYIISEWLKLSLQKVKKISVGEVLFYVESKAVIVAGIFGLWVQ